MHAETQADAEERAYQAAIDAPLRDRADLVAFYEHFSQDAEEGDILAKALDALALALQIGSEAEEEFKTAAVASEGRLSPRQAAIELHALAFPEEMAALTPLQRAMKVHRDALSALEAAGPFDGENPELVALDNAEMDAMGALLAAPYSTRADAIALVSHLRPFVGEKKHPVLKDMGEVTCDVLAKVLDVCSAALAGGDSSAAPCRG